MPWLENLNILSVWWFIFFLLIFLVGYIFVEILLWKDYFFRNNLEKYDNHLFDRIIHYTAWWIVLNIVFFISFHYIDQYKYVTEIFNLSWKIWEILWFVWEVKDLQFIFFSIQYFSMVIILLVFLTIGYKIASNFYRIIDFVLLIFSFFKKKTKRKK